MNLKRLSLFFLLKLMFGTFPLAAQTTIFGSLANFDVFNDTGQVTEGFEIEIDGVQAANIGYTFGGTYIRYGNPTVVPFTGGVYVRYMAPWDPVSQQFTTGTPLPPLPITPTAGHACYNGFMGQAAYLASGCEHFGVSLSVNPTRTVYRWLVADPAVPGGVTPFGTAVSIPAPTYTIVPPANGGVDPVLVAEIDPPPPPKPELQFGDAQWVKIYKTELQREVGLNELLTDDPIVPQDPALTEIAWTILQTNPHRPNNGAILNKSSVGSTTHAVVRRYEFYKYTGVYDPLTHEALCADGVCNTPADGEVGDYVGAQMGAANVGVPSVTVTKSGNGTVTGASGKINCGGTCSTVLTAGAQVSLTETPASNAIFTGWGGACSGLQSTCSFIANDALSVTATFTPIFGLSIGRSGSGTVTGTPGGVLSTTINCGSSCSAKFAAGTSVTLTATPAAGLQFVSWTGDCTSTTPTCTMTISKDSKAQATFK